MTDLRKLLGIKYPIIQGGMANIATGAFAAAISNAGGLGLIASGGYSPDAIREQIRIARSLTDKPFGVNLMLMHPAADEIAELLVEERVGIITTGAGLPGKYIPAWKASGALVFPVVSASAIAKRVESQGADGVIAEGTESGGHVGELTTMALVPQVVNAVSIPVIAAGGIASGAQMLAALALGACGVQIGTTLLRAEECPIHANYKDALLKAKDNDTVVTGRSVNAAVRILRNQMSIEYIKLEKAGASQEELEKFTLGSLRRAVFDGDVKNGSLMAGQVAGMLSEIKPAEVILRELYESCAAESKSISAHPVLN
ncbi:MAG: nitronate monooxygenase [Oscillospiraceae bacterium]|jgi:enoyl-[acyl-carrier protein] reductase II|nr:nitronate monooxygenase [Oscillospiraceae bacterium]